MNKSCTFKNPAITVDLSSLAYSQLTLMQIENSRLINKTKRIISLTDTRFITPEVESGRDAYLRELMLNRGDILVEMDARADLLDDQILTGIWILSSLKNRQP